MKKLILVCCLLLCVNLPALAAQPVVAIHVSEVTQALETIPAAQTTPSGPGTTGNEWWTPWWHYFVMYQSVEEELRSDGTPFVVVTDADITAGSLLNLDGTPKYPILVSLASEAIRDDEVAPLASYVSAGGFLLMGSSSFTRNPDGTTRRDFALASQIGLHMANANLQNWYQTTSFTKLSEHRLVSHVPDGTLTWSMPLTSESSAYNEWGGVTPPNHYIWQVLASGAAVIAAGDNGYPYLTATPYGHGYFIYDAAMQPLIGYGGWAPGMYAYGIFRNAIAWAFEASNLPVIKLSPWPFPYNAAYVVRHDFEDYQNDINSIEASAQMESSAGAKGDYYFCTGTLRVEMKNSPVTIASLQRAVSLYGATIGSHNGGLPNPYWEGLVVSDYDYWHWGPDPALDIPAPAGYVSGGAYASASIANSLADIKGWMAGLNTNTQTWVAPYFNATRDGSYQILDQLGIITSGEQKLSPFPHWVYSTQTPGKRYRFVTLPVSDWYIGADVAQALNFGHTTSTIDALVDYYYDLGALINLYMHEPSTTELASEYILHSAAKPAMWPTNAATVFGWWTNRSTVQMIPVYTVANNRVYATATVAGATDLQTAVEFVLPTWALASNNIQVKLNGALADPSSYRAYHQGIKVLVGTTVSNVEVSYPLVPWAQNDIYSVTTWPFNVSAPGVLGNDSNPVGGALSATLVAPTLHGTLTFNADGSFIYNPSAGFSGADTFTYQASVGDALSNTATVTLNVLAPSAQNDLYAVNTSVLSVPAPGVLGNDSNPLSGSLTVMLVSQPLHGTLNLAPDGSFNYTPTSGFTGTDNFIYQAVAAGVASNPATVTIMVIPPGSQLLFLDDFSGQTGSDPLWTPVLGSWGIVGGLMQGATAANSYGFAYANGNWADYSVQGQIQFPAGAFGGGIGGRVNSSTGAHYGVWVYPEGSLGVSAVLRLVKFSNWTTWSYTPMAQVNLPGVGTSWHTLLATFQGNRIQASYDGTLYIDVTDNSFDSIPSYTSGGISLDMWNSAPYTLSLDNIMAQTVGGPPVAQNDSYSVSEGVTLNVAAPGVLANDTGGGSGATAVIVSQTANGTLNLQSNGGLTYVPTAGFVGTDSFTYQANVGGVMSDTATVTITVTPPGVASVTLNPASVTGGTSSVGTVTLSGPAPSGGAIVTLTSSNTAVATVPATVSVAANEATATVTVTSVPVASTTSVLISATYNTSVQTAVLTVTPPGLSSVSLNPTSVQGGTSSTGTVTLSAPAPSGGAVVTLSSSNASAATVPASVTVAANATTAVFSVSTTPVANNTSVTISAIYNSTTQTATLAVTPAILSSVGLNPLSVMGGTSSAGTVTLSGPAPTGGAVITLSSSNTSAATAPASVTVAANATTANFTITTIPVATNASATISAVYAGTTQTATLTVTAATLTSVSLNPTSVRGGTTSTGTVTLNGRAPSGGALVTLTSSNISAATVPASVTIAANATTATFTVTSIPVASNTSVTISAIYAGTTRTAILTVTAATLTSVSLNPTSVKGGGTSTGTVTLNGPAPAAGALVTLSSSNTNVATVPASVTVSTGSTTATFAVSTTTVTSNRMVIITAVRGATQRAILTVTP
ncbi:MAG: cadherin-like domain-containing protein [Acidobacteriia bacterium]|nr:cadherin-like domain-containing protein [Terriglobia bacterium]